MNDQQHTEEGEKESSIGEKRPYGSHTEGGVRRGGVQHTWLTQTTGVEVPEIMAEPPDVILGMS